MTVQATDPLWGMLSRIVIPFTALVLTGACMSTGSTDDERPPEREFDQSTGWNRMEEAAAEAIDGLPDFPGFEARHMQTLECTHEGVADEEYINLELSYEFSEDVSKDPLVRETYLELLRDKWEQANYDIHRDRPSGTGKNHSLEARRPDGINYWYWVAGLTQLKIQSGCMKAVEDWSPECPEPLGGVAPENDQAAKRYCGTDDTTEEADAIAPFEGSPAAVVPFSTDSTRREIEGTPGPFEGQL